MRQIGSISSGSEAERFANYMVARGIAAHAEQDDGVWVIWVRDENDIDAARQEMEQFQADPANSRYRDADQKADSIRREQAEKREQVQKNIVHMRGQWGRGAAKKAPLIFVLIAMSIVATLWTGRGRNSNVQHLAFRQNVVVPAKTVSERFATIKEGQIWRLITPIFVHLDWLHLIFNMYMTYSLGALIEHRRGTLRLAAMVLAMALLSNAAQGVVSVGVFGGMSGVVYGFFGYRWMKTLFDPRSGLALHQGTIIILIIWFFVCFTPLVGNIANTAHAVGLGVGIVIGYWPVLIQRQTGE